MNKTSKLHVSPAFSACMKFNNSIVIIRITVECSILSQNNGAAVKKRLVLKLFSDSEGCLVDPATNGGKRYYDSDSGTLQYPKAGVDRYGNNKKCIWSIKTNKYASAIKIKFDDVDIEFDKFCGEF